MKIIKLMDNVGLVQDDGATVYICIADTSGSTHFEVDKDRVFLIEDILVWVTRMAQV